VRQGSRWLASRFLRKMQVVLSSGGHRMGILAAKAVNGRDVKEQWMYEGMRVLNDETKERCRDRLLYERRS